MNKYIERNPTKGWIIRESGQITARIINSNPHTDANTIMKEALEGKFISPSDMVCIDGKWWYVKEWMKENKLWLVQK